MPMVEKCTESTDMEQLFQLSDGHFDNEELARLFPTGSVTVKKMRRITIYKSLDGKRR